MATSGLGVESEDTFDSISYRPVSEKLPASRSQPTHFASSARLNSTVREQLASVPVLVGDAVVKRFGDAGPATESSSNTKVISVI